MVINEIFYSLQGEGFLTGIPSVFVRLAGCPLRCKWCDTKYAWDNQAGNDYSIEKICQTIQQGRSKFIVITGGEPMVNSDLPQLLQKLKSLGKHITVETAGITFIPDLACDLMSISPKLSNSTLSAVAPVLRNFSEEGLAKAEPDDPKAVTNHKYLRLDINILRKLIDNYNYQLKFVVDSQDDLAEIQQTIENLGNVDSDKIMLMPQAATRDELLAKSSMVAEMCKRTGYTFCQRLQILLWNNKRGT